MPIGWRPGIEAILAHPSELHRLRESAAQWSNADAALHVVRACEGILRTREPAISRDPVAVK
jgi:hypothetical protein